MTTTTTALYHHDYPYRLKLQHPGLSELRVERKGRWIVVDPAEAPDPASIVVLTSGAPHRARAVVQALRDGARLTIVASETVLAWLRTVGSFEGHPGGATLDGVEIVLHPAVAPTEDRPHGALARAAAGLARVRGGGPLRSSALSPDDFPDGGASIVQLTFPDGSRLVHLDVALHAGTPTEWVADAAGRFGGSEWLVVGQPWNQGEAVARQVGAFGAKRVLVAELVNGARRELGLPTELVTPLRDRLVAAGVEAHVFATQTSFRFE
jgi:hypothetical protein